MYQMLEKQSLTEKRKRNSTWYKTIKEIESIMKTLLPSRDRQMCNKNSKMSITECRRDT